MALINCPECDKKISDKAKICPNCGFPIQEYLNSQVEIESSKRFLDNKLLLQEQMSKKKEFYFFDKPILLNKNDVLNSMICKFLRYSLDYADYYFFDNYKSLKPSDFSERDLDIIAKENYDNIKEECFESVDILNQIVFDGEIDLKLYDYKQHEITPIDYQTYYEGLIDDFYKIRKMSLNIEYELEQNADKIKKTYRNGNFIDGVRSNTVGGLIGQSIKASLINSVTSSFSNSKMKKELNRVENSKDELQNSFDSEIYQIIMLNSNKLISSIYDSLINWYIDIGVLCELKDYPTKEYDIQELQTVLKDPMREQTVKITYLYDAIVSNPTDVDLYELAINNLVFNEKNVTDFSKLVEYVNVKDILENDECNIDYSMDKSDCDLLKIDDICFESIKEKDLYISDCAVYDSSIKDFLDERQWFDNEKVKTNLNNIMNSNEAGSEYFKNLLNKISESEDVLNKYQTKFTIFALDALKMIDSDYSVNDMMNEEFIHNETKRFGLIENEIPIKYYKYGSLDIDKYSHAHGLLVTNMRMALTYSSNDEIFYSFYPTKEYVDSFISTDGSIFWRSPSEIHFVDSVSYRNNPTDLISSKYSSSVFFTDIGALDRKSDESNCVNKFSAFFDILQKEYLTKIFDVSDFDFPNIGWNLTPYTIILKQINNVNKKESIYKKWYEAHRNGINIFQKENVKILRHEISDEETDRSLELNHIANLETDDNKTENIICIPPIPDKLDYKENMCIPPIPVKLNYEESECKSVPISVNSKKKQSVELKRELYNKFKKLIISVYPDFFDMNNFLEYESLNNDSEVCVEAFNILLQLSNIGESDYVIMYYLAISYCCGLGVKIDYTKAKNMFEKVKSKIPDALYFLTVIYLNEKALYSDKYNWHESIVEAAINGSVQAGIRLCIWTEGEVNGFILNEETKKTINTIKEELSNKGNRLAKVMIAEDCYRRKLIVSHSEMIAELLDVVDNTTPNDWVDTSSVYNLLFLFYES